jgi:hypothetical protein
MVQIQIIANTVVLWMFMVLMLHQFMP